jgi:hypothetical protein
MGDLGKYNIEMFPDELIALNEEIRNHPDLLVILATQQDKDVYVQIAEISAWCGVILDASYTRDDIIKLCGTLTDILRKKREINIYTPPGALH